MQSDIAAAFSGEDLRTVITGFQVFRNPNIFFIGLNTSERPLGIAAYDRFLVSADRCYFFFNPMWSLASSVYRRNIVDRLNFIAEKFPQHRYTLLVNDSRELSIAGELAKSVMLHVCGEHALADEDVFYYAAREETYSAVCVSKFEAYKRIHLAADVSGLCLISPGIDRETLAQLGCGDGRVHCPTLDGKRLQPDEVLEFLLVSRCGLILSAREGQSRATIEYLLAGLPIVSTMSEGGRDRFLTPENSLIVRADPRDVRAAVDHIAEGGFERSSIARSARGAVIRERAWLSRIVDARLTDDGLEPVNIQSAPLRHHGFSSSRSLAANLRIYQGKERVSGGG